jgi:hypothetical protein
LEINKPIFDIYDSTSEESMPPWLSKAESFEKQIPVEYIDHIYRNIAMGIGALSK